MTNKLVVIINSLKVPKIKKILLYEITFIVPNYSCLQNPRLGGYRPQIPVLSVLNQNCWTPPPNKIPGYATVFTDKINHIAPLPNAVNIKNTQDLIQNLKDTPKLPHYSLASLDSTNLHSNIPVIETRTILTDMLKYELVNPQTQQEILKWYDVIAKQDYFAHNKNTVIQYDGLAMDAPSSGLIAEIFLQHIEYIHLTHFISYSKIFLIFGTLRLFMTTTNLFVIANVKQLRT